MLKIDQDTHIHLPVAEWFQVSEMLHTSSWVIISARYSCHVSSVRARTCFALEALSESEKRPNTVGPLPDIKAPSAP